MDLPRKRFRARVTASLSVLPLRTARGSVLRERREANFGFPGGKHESIRCWVYRAHGSAVELLFGFYSNFTADDLLCKSMATGSSLPQGAGATIQFNADRCIDADGEILALHHSGAVTVGSGVGRRRLVEGIYDRAPEAAVALGGLDVDHGWPFRVGSTGDIPELIDRLAIYAYAVEQAKRSIRGDSPLPRLYPQGEVEAQALGVPVDPSHGQGFVVDAAARRAVELRAMAAAKRHFARSWEHVEDVSATQSYDLHCTKGHRELRVEVKGTTGDGSVVLLTPNEVQHARTHFPDVALFVLSGVVLDLSDANRPHAKGGVVRVIAPWNLDESGLVPQSYAYFLP